MESQAAALKDRRLNQGLGRATANAEAQTDYTRQGNGTRKRHAETARGNGTRKRHAETESPDPLIKTTTRGNAKCLI
nr:MAG TPA: hypothetical protein [Caudoviricetes sp.]